MQLTQPVWYRSKFYKVTQACLADSPRTSQVMKPVAVVVATKEVTTKVVAVAVVVAAVAVVLAVVVLAVEVFVLVVLVVVLVVVLAVVLVAVLVLVLVAVAPGTKATYEALLVTSAGRLTRFFHRFTGAFTG